MTYWVIEDAVSVPRRYAKIGAIQRIAWVNEFSAATRFESKADAEWHAKCARDDGESCEVHEHISLSGPPDLSSAAIAKATKA